MKRIYRFEREVEAYVRGINRQRLHRKSIKGLVGENRTLTAQQKYHIQNVFQLAKQKISFLFHEFYVQKSGVYDSRYIPDDLYYRYIDPYYNDWEAANYLDNKCLYDLLFPIMRQPKVVAYRQNHFWFNSKKKLITLNEVVELVAQEKRIFVKCAEESHGGKGVYCLEGDDILTEIKSIVEKIECDIVIQRGLEQCGELSRINASSINTVRMISMLSPGRDISEKKDFGDEVKIYSRILRMGVNNARVDNASSGGITCGIDEEGRLKNRAFDVKGNVYLKHPNSGISFETVVIPNIESIEKSVKEMHVLMPHFRLISWDIAIEADGKPTLIEANLKDGELDFHQLNNGPIFGDDTLLILKEVFGRKA